MACKHSKKLTIPIKSHPGYSGVYCLECDSVLDVLATPEKKKVGRKAKARPRVKASACSTAKLAPEDFGGTYCTKRSPGGIPDPKVSEALILEAMSLVGTPKERNESFSYPKDGAYLTVAYGGGADSTAILVGLDQLWKETGNARWVPVVITFADTGGEHPHTYDYITKVLEPWLKKKAFRGAPNRPLRVIKCAYSTLQRGGGWGTAYTLEQHSLVNQSLPAISMGQHTCSTKYKIDAQQAWFKVALEFGQIPSPGKRRIVRAIGYDATEEKRLKGHSTYASADEEAGGLYRAWYPLMEWGWDRARCLAEAKAELGRAPTKSSCYFCGAMRPNEIVLLAHHYPKLLERALFMENVARHGRHKPHGGLNRQYYWTDFALGDISKLSPMASVFIAGGVIRRGVSKNTVVKGTVGLKSAPADIAPNETFVQGSGPLLSKSTVDRIIRQAKAYVAAAPDGGKQVPGWRAFRSGEKADGRETRKVKKIRGGKEVVVREVLAKIRNVKGKGQLEKDMALHHLTNKIPAFTEVLGFRCSPGELDWNSLLDKHLPESEAKASAISVDKILEIDRRTRSGCGRRVGRNPVRLPIATFEDPVITGF